MWRVKDQVLTQLENGVLTVRMNRPEKKNALTAAMYSAMADTIERAESDRSVKVLLFTGTDGIFTAGNDLVDFRDNPPQGPGAPVNRFIANMVRTDVPIVAAVDGVAVGIGTTMLLHFDQVFATERARFVMPFINLALVPEAGSSMLLSAACGYQKAAELLLLGEPFSGAEALEYGIIAKVCEPATLLEEAREVAHKLASKPRAALRASKRLMRRPAEPLAGRVVAEMDVFSQRLAAPEAQEAFTAFFEKRAPDFEQFD
jgi:enoyl-CoA hydratase/carnithine racemase